MKQHDDNEIINLDGLSEISKRAISSNLLEGILLEAELIEILRQVDNGTITLQEAKEKGLAHILETPPLNQKAADKVSPDMYGGVDLSGLSQASRDAMVTHIIDGIIPDPELIATLRLVDAGEIDIEEFTRREQARIEAKYSEKTEVK